MYLLSDGHARMFLFSVGHVRVLSAFQNGPCPFYFQGIRGNPIFPALGQPIGWENPCSDICAGQAGVAVSPHFFSI